MREFLARKKVEHRFVNVRAQPIPGPQALKLIRTHRRGIAKKGKNLVEVEIGRASDAELEKLFLGREGALRAPTVSDGETLFSGFDEATLRSLVGI